MTVLGDFLSPEAGQRRRAWLEEKAGAADDALRYYLGPTGIPDKLKAVAQALNYTDAGDMVAAADASRGFWNSPSVGNAAELAAAGGALAIPFVGARMIDDGVDVVGDAYRSFKDDAGRFAADEGGSVGPGDPAATRGAEIMDMLTSGRASEVTDEMLDLGDGAANAQLSQYLYDNYDLPMDEASRMQRAGEMGFRYGDLPAWSVPDARGDLENPQRFRRIMDRLHNGQIFHGTPRDFQAFSTDAPSVNDSGWYGRGIYMGDADLASEYAERGGQVIPTLQRGRFDTQKADKIRVKDEAGSNRITMKAQERGFDGIDVTLDDPRNNIYDQPWERVIFDPRNIRSRFARFDPRLSHLRNLSAGVAGAAALGMNDDETMSGVLGMPSQSALRGYLNQ